MNPRKSFLPVVTALESRLLLTNSQADLARFLQPNTGIVLNGAGVKGKVAYGFPGM